MLDSAVRSIPIPKRLPRLNDVAKIVPGMKEKDTVGSNDPEVPFDPSGKLAAGHTLRLAIYEGLRSPKKLWSGLVMVDESGLIQFDDIGSARVGGHTLNEARTMIAAVFRTAGRAAAHLHVQVISVENTPLLAVEGDVQRPLVTICYKNMTVRDALMLAGGRASRGGATAVYVTRNGQRSFFATEASAQERTDLQPGDIVFFSPDL